jgi:hypothetical protein
VRQLRIARRPARPRDGYLTSEFTVKAEAPVRGIYAIADRCPPKRE